MPSYSFFSNTSGAIYAGVPTVDFGCECRTDDWGIRNERKTELIKNNNTRNREVTELKHKYRSEKWTIIGSQLESQWKFTKDMNDAKDKILSNRNEIIREFRNK